MRSSVLLALLLVALLSTASAALVPRRIMLEDTSACEDKCQKEFATRRTYCLAVFKYEPGGIYSLSSLLEVCPHGTDPWRMRDECNAACKPVSKPPETPTGTGSADIKAPADTAAANTKPTENPAGTESADTQPPAPATDSADPPVETGAAEGKPPADPK
jgi:hypothetical protein